MSAVDSRTRPEISRLPAQHVSSDNPYEPPDTFLEVEVGNPITHGLGSGRYTDYEVRMKTKLPVFRLKDSSVRRRYSDFEWLRKELERDSKIVVPPLPGKAWQRQIPAFLRNNDGIFDDDFIEDRRKGLEEFIIKITGHPLAQNERALHVFLQEEKIDHDNYMPGKVRST